MRMRWGLALALTVGCSSASFEVAPELDTSSTDSATEDTRVADTTVTDDTTVRDSTATDGTTSDSKLVDSNLVDSNLVDTKLADTGLICRPFWCGCGTCVASEIVCTQKSYGCPLECPSSTCPEAARTDICTTEGARCRRNGIAGEQACMTTADCPIGKCCDGSYTPPARGKCGAC